MVLSVPAADDQFPRHQEQMAAAQTERCSYQHCVHPVESDRFHQIDGDCGTGGQDWSSLDGKVLCHACYQQFRNKGTLERKGRAVKPPLPIDQRRCSYEHCEHPVESGRSYLIDEGCVAGDKDWSSLVGKVLCSACYEQFRKKGTLERKGRARAQEQRESRICQASPCRKRCQPGKYHVISAETKAGSSIGRDWSWITPGAALCNACFKHYRDYGNFYRPGTHIDSVPDPYGMDCSSPVDRGLGGPRPSSRCVLPLICHACCAPRTRAP